MEAKLSCHLQFDTSVLYNNVWWMRHERNMSNWTHNSNTIYINRQSATLVYLPNEKNTKLIFTNGVRRIRTFARVLPAY